MSQQDLTSWLFNSCLNKRSLKDLKVFNHSKFQSYLCMIFIRHECQLRAIPDPYRFCVLESKGAYRSSVRASMYTTNGFKKFLVVRPFDQQGFLYTSGSICFLHWQCRIAGKGYKVSLRVAASVPIPHKIGILLRYLMYKEFVLYFQTLNLSHCYGEWTMP